MVFPRSLCSDEASAGLDLQRYLDAYPLAKRDVILPDVPPSEPEQENRTEVMSRNPGNMHSWRHKPPYAFKRIPRPIYKEITFIDLQGRERIKIKDGRISEALVDAREREQTYCRAEDYFARLGRLQKGEIHASRVIGPCVKGWLQNSPEGIKVSGESAYAGKENPLGKKFEGIIRWATPVHDLATAHNYVITRMAPPDIPRITVDKDRLIQVLINLLSNSIKYTPDAGRIIIGTELKGNDISFSVADNGYGIPLWAHEEVFKKFFQADSVMSQKVGGCGLGLTISKGIVEEHGGSIHCESPIPEGRFSDLLLGAERNGTIFIVRLPMHRLPR